MGFKDWIANMFKDQTTNTTSEPINEPKDVEFADLNPNEINELIDSFSHDVDSLRLDDLERHSDALLNYLGYLTKDLNSFRYTKDLEAQTHLKSSLMKIKHIVINSLELKNILSQLLDYYHKPLLNVLDELKVKMSKTNFDELKNKINDDKIIIEKLIENLNIFVIYDKELNPGTVDMETIEKELRNKVNKTEITNIVRDLTEGLRYLTNKRDGVRIKYSNNPLELFKQ